MKWLFCLGAGLLIFWGCSKDYSQEGGLAQGCLNCSYLPVCDSSVFKYVDSTGPTIDTLENAVYILGDTTINGVNWKKLSAFANFQGGILANCSDDDYKFVLPLSALGINIDSLVQDVLDSLNLPFPIPPGTIPIPSTIKTSLLKAGLGVNAGWTDTIFNFSLPPILTAYAALKYTIVEKGVSRTLFNHVYPNVIHVKSELQAGGTIGNIPANVVIDYYFAQNVGLIEMKVTSGMGSEQGIKLYSYTL